MLKLFLFFFILLISTNSISQSPPAQPISGPGGNIYSNNGVLSTNNTSLFSADGYWLFEPDSPKPDSADLIVFNHGYGVFNPGPYAKWIEHLVKKGNIVIFPKYQLSDASLPSTYTPNAITGILDAINELNTNPTRVKPRMRNLAMIGHSFGGVITANLVTNYATYNIPKPKCFMLCQPGTGGINSGRLVSYANMDTDYKALIVVGEDDIIVGDSFGREIMDSTGIPTIRKNFITHVADYRGFPILEATHNEPLAADFNYDGGTISTVITGGYAASKLDAVDFYCYWKLADALLNCTFYGTNCEYAFGDTPEQRGMGNWSDGITANELIIEPSNTILSTKTMEKSDVAIFPNPTNQFINIEAKKDLFSLHIRNNLGQIVLNKESEISNSIDLSRLDKGSYYLTLNGLYTFLIIKN